MCSEPSVCTLLYFYILSTWTWSVQTSLYTVYSSYGLRKYRTEYRPICVLNVLVTFPIWTTSVVVHKWIWTNQNDLNQPVLLYYRPIQKWTWTIQTGCWLSVYAVGNIFHFEPTSHQCIVVLYRNWFCTKQKLIWTNYCGCRPTVVPVPWAYTTWCKQYKILFVCYHWPTEIVSEV